MILDMCIFSALTALVFGAMGTRKKVSRKNNEKRRDLLMSKILILDSFNQFCPLFFFPFLFFFFFLFKSNSISSSVLKNCGEKLTHNTNFVAMPNNT